MTRRRLGFWIILILTAILLATGLWVRQAWHSLLQANGIEKVTWQGVDLSLSSLSFDTFDIRQVRPDRRMTAKGQGLTLTWQWSGAGVQVTSLTIRQLQFNLHSEADSDKAPSTALSLPDLPKEPPAWLPQQVTIEHFSASLPCATGRCPLEGSLSASREVTLLPLQASLSLIENKDSGQNPNPRRDVHQVQLDVAMDGTWPDALNLTVNLAADEKRTLTARTEYRQAGADQKSHWTGTVNLPRLPKAGWVLDWLSQWQSVAINDLPPQPRAAEITAQWALQWPSESRFLRHISGSLAAHANLPDPWPLPGVGTLHGNVEVGLAADQGQWLAQTVQADLQLSQPAKWVTQLPEPLRPKNLSIRIRPAGPVTEMKTGGSRLPINLTLKSRGKVSIDITSHLAFATQAPWRVAIGHTRVQGSLAHYTVGDWQLEKPQVDLRFSGQADTESLKLRLAPDSQLSIKRVDNPEVDTALALNGLHADLSSLQIEAAYRTGNSKLNSLSLRGPVAVAARQIHYPGLQAQSWQFSGDLAANLTRLMLNGKLEANSGASADIDLRYPFNAALTFDTQSRLSGKEGSDSWAGLLEAWPKTLTLDKGTILASASLRQPRKGPVELSGTLDVEDLDGTYNRMAWTDLDSYVTADLNENQFTVQASNLSVGQINPGIPIGPVTVAGSYQASLDNPATGELILKAARSGLLGGNVRIKPQTLSLAQTPVQIAVDLNRLQLSELMALYPAKNLSGTGILSGQIPVSIGSKGASVAGGKVHALAPGGRLQLPGDRLKGLAQGNAAMETVAEAMKNFHYSVLNSTIDYAPDGTLGLGLHIEGNNPNVRAGQPVVLNINLEEDIPALLTSLQLSGRVNDAVTERVKKLIEKQQPDR